MADISKIKVSGTTYNLKDAVARTTISDIQTNYAKKSEINSVVETAMNNTMVELTDAEIAALFV